MKYTDPYLDKIASQHKIRPKFMAWLAVILEKVEDCADLLRSFDREFDLETARGVQLDIMGQVVGISRLLDFQPEYADPLLTDDFYRMVIKAKISLNQWGGTIQGIKDLWTGIFSGYELDVIDHQDMTMTLRIYNMQSMFESEFMSRGYLAPKPEAVRINYEFVITRTMETTLYIGGIIEYVKQQWNLRDPPPMDDFDAHARLYCGGKLVFYTRFHLGGPVERRFTMHGGTDRQME